MRRMNSKVSLFFEELHRSEAEMYMRTRNQCEVSYTIYFTDSFFLLLCDLICIFCGCKYQLFNRKKYKSFSNPLCTLHQFQVLCVFLTNLSSRTSFNSFRCSMLCSTFAEHELLECALAFGIFYPRNRNK